jgi:hypothetical protein
MFYANVNTTDEDFNDIRQRCKVSYILVRDLSLKLTQRKLNILYVSRYLLIRKINKK